MLSFPSDKRIFIRPGVTDMRKSINGLSVLSQNLMNQHVTSGNYFIFCNRQHKLIKILYWDRNGFCIWSKRLEEGCFPWPSDEQSVLELTQTQITWLLKGIDFFSEHKPIIYKTV